MTDLSQFDVEKQKKSTRQDIFFSLKDMVSVWVKEFTTSLWKLMWTPAKGKNQITKQLSRFEKRLQRKRD